MNLLIPGSSVPGALVAGTILALRGPVWAAVALGIQTWMLTFFILAVLSIILAVLSKVIEGQE